MTTHADYLLIADISGYTQFLTSSEQDHANPILQSLLSSLVEQVGEPLHFWKMDGDAVLAYSTQQEFPSGETFLTIARTSTTRLPPVDRTSSPTPLVHARHAPMSICWI